MSATVPTGRECCQRLVASHFETYRSPVIAGRSGYAQAVLARRALAIAPVPIAVVASILPWSVSGTSARSAFALVHALEGVSSALPGWERIGLRAAYSLPVIAACALAAAVLGRIRLSAFLGVVLGAARRRGVNHRDCTTGRERAPRPVGGRRWLCYRDGDRVHGHGAAGRDAVPDEPAPAASPEGLTNGGVAPPVSKSRSPWPRVVAVLVALALVGGGVSAAITLSSSPSGAASPSAAVSDLLSAADHADLLGVLDATAPGERQVIEPGLTGLAHQLERLRVLSSGTNLAEISGLGLHFSGVTTRTQTLSSDLAAVTITSGRVTESVDPSKLPVGSFVNSLAGSALQGGERSQTTTVESGASTPIVTEKVGGRWYVSLGYTIVVDALRAKGGSGVPPSATSAIRPSGGTAPTTRSASSSMTSPRSTFPALSEISHQAKWVHCRPMRRNSSDAPNPNSTRRGPRSI